MRRPSLLILTKTVHKYVKITALASFAQQIVPQVFNLQASKRESPGACLLRRCYLYVLKQQHPPSAGTLILVPALAASMQWAIYIGLTKRRLIDEWLRWLTERGSLSILLHGVGGKNRPVLLQADGSTITESEAKALGAVLLLRGQQPAAHQHEQARGRPPCARAPLRPGGSPAPRDRRGRR